MAKKIHVVKIDLGMGRREYAEYKFKALGLDDLTLKSLKGRKLLDVGCNDGGDFVYAARKKGLDAEGIGARAPNNKGFMKWNIKASYPGDGSIMRSDGEYEIVVACPSVELSTVFSSQGESAIKVGSAGCPVIGESIREEIKRMEGLAKITLFEALRVLKPNGLLIAYPELNLLEEKLGPGLRGYEVTSYAVPGILQVGAELSNSPIDEAIFGVIGYQEGGKLKDFVTHRTVIRKKGNYSQENLAELL